MFVPLELTGLTKVFATPTGPFVAVKDVNARILAGTFVAILGHSGCGKSTVLSIVAGLDKATYGGVIIDGHEVTAPGAERAIVFQSPCLLPWLNVLENVMVAATQGATPKSKKEARELARFYLDIVGIGDSEMQMPGELSLGTQQCVSLARALVVEPRFLLLDEPFSQLDSLTRFELQDLLLRVWESSGKTVVMVTHDIDEALYLADHLVLMTDGPGGDGRRRLHRAVRAAAEPRRRAGSPALPRGPPARDRLPRAPRPPVAPERARRRARQAARLTPGSPSARWIRWVR